MNGASSSRSLAARLSHSVSLGRLRKELRQAGATERHSTTDHAPATSWWRSSTTRPKLIRTMFPGLAT
jgi:hypothetical protein